MADIVLFRVRDDAEERIRDLNISPFTRQLQEVGYICSLQGKWENQYLAVYDKSARNTTSRLLREKGKK